MSSPAQICITGTGVVSPAGWGRQHFADALRVGQLPGDVTGPERYFAPPAPDEIRKKFRHARLRRSTRLAQLMVGAAMEALGDRLDQWSEEECRRLQIIVSLYNGNVLYTSRFFSEVLEDPSIASPILFPETVFNAPAGHLAAVLGCGADHSTLVGDGANFLTALALAANRLQDGLTDRILVLAAEEEHALVRRAIALFDPAAPVAEGAGALLLERRTDPPPGAIALHSISDPALYSLPGPAGIAGALKALHDQASLDPHTLLTGNLTGFQKIARVESRLFGHWPGPRLDIASIFGWSPGASAAWQLLAAHERLRQEPQLHAAQILTAGDTHQAITSRLQRIT